MIFMDTETTGLPLTFELNPKDQPRLIEIAGIQTRPDLTVVRSFSALINPGVPIPPGATKVHGITDADVARCPEFSVVLMSKIIPFFLGEQTVIGYNVQFDLNILRWELQRVGMEFRFPWCHEVIDAIQYRGEKRISLSKWSLEVLGDDWEPQSHRALGDTERLLACYRSLTT